MGRHYQILLPLLSLFLVRVDLTDLVPLRLNVQMVRILDGDTIELSHGNYLFKLRLSRIDAPEMDQPFLNGKRGAGSLSHDCLTSIVKSSPSVLVLEGFDMYRRMLGEYGNSNLEMIKRGCAVIYPYARFSSKAEKGIYLRQMSAARRENRGLWGRGGIQSPKVWRKLNYFRKRISHQQ